MIIVTMMMIMMKMMIMMIMMMVMIMTIMMIEIKLNNAYNDNNAHIYLPATGHHDDYHDDGAKTNQFVWTSLTMLKRENE